MPTPNNGRIPETTDRATPTESDQPNYVTTHDPDGPSKRSTTVIHALADVMGADVSETSFRLYDSVDPDALDRIFASTDGNTAVGGHVAFTVEGYRVTVYEDGRIVITPPAE
jgi:hypothetical protein